MSVPRETALPMSPRLERALRWAARWHDGQRRKASPVPYVVHVVGVALILDRAGYGEDAVIAGLLHDAVEDTEATLDDVDALFGPAVAALVAHGSETKRDADGHPRPWIDRKRDHLAALATAPAEARAVVLADKIHNLLSMACDLADGRPLWSIFNAGRDDVLWYYRVSIATLAAGEADDPRLARLAAEARRLLAEIEAAPS